MAEQVNHPDISSVARELDAALANLDAALAQASHSVSVIRNNISQVSTLAESVREMEAAITLARQNLSLPLGTARQATSSPPLRAVPARDAMWERSERVAMTGKAISSPAEPEPTIREPVLPPSEPEPTIREPVLPPAEPEPTIREAMLPPSEPELTIREPVLPPEHLATLAPPEQEAPAAEPTVTPSEPRPSRPVSHCLRLGVSSRAGSLDLKAVDGAVNENPAVVDVALLDYNGRQATLKLWINGSADPVGVGEALLGSLRRRLGDERDADIRLEFEEGSAA